MFLFKKTLIIYDKNKSYINLILSEVVQQKTIILNIPKAINIILINKFIQIQNMSKQKLAELVMQKMQQKKEKQERNRPHREVLQLLDYLKLKTQISQLQKQINQQESVFRKLQASCQDFQNTGKKVYPRIIVKPEFIASQNIQSLFKQFYRKSANTFLRQDLLRKKQYEVDTSQFEQIKNTYAQLLNKQTTFEKLKQNQHKKINEKRVRNLKQDLRLRSIKQQQENIKKIIASEKQSHKDLLAQYQLKKTNLHKRIEWSEQLVKLIEDQKKLIEKTYNPISYRDYLKKIFNLRTKNQSIKNSLVQITKKVQQSQFSTQKKAEFLEKFDNLYIQGKCSDTPSKKKRYSVGSLQKQKKTKPKHNSLLFNLKKTVTLQQMGRFETPNKSLAKNKSISTSIGKTTASSTSNLFKNSSRRSYSNTGFSQLKKSRRLGQTFS